MTVLQKFDTWKEFLEDRVKNAMENGMSEQTISMLAVQIGEFLADKVDPKNNEQRLLKELWDVGDEADKQVLARLMVKLVKH